MKKIVVVGIPDTYLDDLISKLENHPKCKSVEMIYTAQQFFNDYKPGSADALLIDISIPDSNFTEFAKEARKLDSKTLIIGVATRNDSVDVKKFKNKIPNSQFLFKIDDNTANVNQIFDWLENKGRMKKKDKGIKKTILVVDDFENTLNIIEYTLKSNGYEVIGALSGKEALQKLQQGAKPDLIITDLNMPGMDGFELIKAIRKMPGHEQTPIFILTTDFSFEKKLRAKELGINAWIQKPYKIEEFLNIIKQTLS